jgi:hypothetical protein
MADVFCWHHRRRYQTDEVGYDMIRLAQVRTFTHEWTRDELQNFTEDVIKRLDKLDEKQN